LHSKASSSSSTPSMVADFAEFVMEMRENLSELKSEFVNIKATLDCVQLSIESFDNAQVCFVDLS
jgi:hypothetical protein